MACVLVCSLSLGLAPQNAYADVRKSDLIMGQSVDSRGLSVAQCPNLDCEYALVEDGSGTVYFERNSTAPIQIASITKIMTAYVALKYAPLDTIVTVSAAAASVGESTASLQEGDTLSLELALQGLMISSGNDASIAIAETVGGVLSNGTATGSDAEQVFVDKMNEEAAAMGLIDTVFRNPHGLDDYEFIGDQHSTAVDVVTMAKAALTYDTFRNIVSMPNALITVTHADGTVGTIELTSTNQLFGNYEGIAGIKTGFTALAGASFAGLCNRDGRDMFAVVIHSTDETQRFWDASTLLDWVYEHEISYLLANSDQTRSMQVNGQVTDVPVVAKVAHSEWIDKTIDATLADPTQALTIFDLDGNISQSVEYNTVTGDIKAGDKLGTLTFRQRNDVLATVDIVACEDVAAPDLFQGIGIWWDRLFRGFSGESKVADSVLINQTPLVNNKEVGAA